MFDFHSVYLNRVLEDGEIIYMEQPPHYKVVDCSRYVVKLQKSLYGLKQASRRWYKTLCHLLAKIGFKRSIADPAVFCVRLGKHVVVLFIHVDDTTIIGSSTLLINEFKRCIEKDFEIMDLGPISWLLGLAIVRNRAKQTLSISQKTYIESIIRCFNLEDAKELTVPIDSDIHLSKADCPTSDEEKAEMKKIPYREAIGALNWVAVAS